MTGQQSQETSSNRRTFLKGTGALAIASAAAGCSGGGSSSGGSGGEGGSGGSGGSDGGASTSQKPPSFENKAGNKVGETFEAVKELAKEEDAATAYATIDRGPFQKWMEGFKNAYDGVDIQHVVGGSEKLISRWETEYNTDNVKGDFFISTSNVKRIWQKDQAMTLKADYMPSFGEAPEKFKSPKGHWIATRQVLGNTFYNKNKVDPSKYDTWMDVVTDESLAGGDYAHDPTPNMFLMSWMMDTQGEEYFEAMRDLEPRWVDSHTDLARLCGAGEFPIAFTYTHKMGRFGSKMPIDYLKFDPTPSVISPGVINNKAPAPNTALLFMNWLTSKEGQMLLGKTQYIPWHPDAKYTAYEGVYPSDEYEVDTISPEVDIDKTNEKWKEIMGDQISSGA
ncbi:MAG: ABC transporter substrate-binding protein [Haloferacaceae archaeon]